MKLSDLLAGAASLNVPELNLEQAAREAVSALTVRFRGLPFIEVIERDGSRFLRLFD